MSELIVSEFITLDGVVEAPGGERTHPHAGWALDYMSEEQGEYKLAEVLAAESLLLGRVTYEGFAAAWPIRDGVFADKMNEMPKHVASTTLRDPVWNATVLEGDVVEAVRELKESDGGPILVAGSATLVKTLMRAELVDELRLMVFPVSIGGGLRLFPQDESKQVWSLADHRTFASGVSVQTYHPG